MSRQIQIRRGTAMEHNNFTGKIGEITMDTTNNTIRVHDGQTPGGTILAKQSEIPEIANADYVVESQLPTAENNYTWYRKYKSGWVEQGGRSGPYSHVFGGTYMSAYDADTITLPITMASTNVSIKCNPNIGSALATGLLSAIDKLTLRLSSANATLNDVYVDWSISGLVV